MTRIVLLILMLVTSNLYAVSPADLIAHYKLNENTASDGDNLVTNGDFTTWTVPGTPTGWAVTGESGNDPEVDEAATGEAHADTPTLGGGMCNIYTSDGTSAYIKQIITLVTGRKYRFSMNVDTVTAGGISFYDHPTDMFPFASYTTSGIKTFTFVATGTTLTIHIATKSSTASDVTFDDVSIKLCAAEDSSGNDHDGLIDFTTPELVTNGAAPTDLTGWNQSPGTQWSIVGNKFQGAGNGAVNYLYQDFGAVVGRKYKFSYEVTDNSLVGGTTSNQLILSTLGSFGSNSLSSAADTHTYYLTATVEASANNQLRLALSSNATGGTIDIDNISIELWGVDTADLHTAGKINGAFDFDGTADYIEIADHADFTPALTPFSVSAWVYMHDATGFVIASKGVLDTDGEWNFATSVTTDTLGFFVFDESRDNCYLGRRSTITLTTYQNQWIHLVATSDGGDSSSSIKIHLNGERIDNANEESDGANFESAEDLAHAVWIGRFDTTYANGLIDNVMLFGTELTLPEVQILYNNGAATEIPAELNEQISPRRHNLSPLPLRRRYDF